MKKIIAIILTVTALCVMLSACGKAKPTEGLEYELSADGTEYAVIGLGTAIETDIVIPNTYEGKPVTSIGSQAFFGCESLTSINIPDSVTSIGHRAFAGCSSLTSINIPDSVTSIGYRAFYGCTQLMKIENVVSYVGKWAVDCDTNVTSVALRTGTVGIADSAFDGCSSLASITIPDSVTSICGAAFSGCSSLTSINIPDSVTSICDNAFSGCRSLTSINIPDSVTSIGNSAFSRCSSLTSINIPDSVTSIGDSAFWYCSSLTDINFSGTKAQWEAITKGPSWNANTGEYVIHCTDGDIAKS